MFGRAVLAFVQAPSITSLRNRVRRDRYRFGRTTRLGQRRLTHELLEQRELLAADLTALSVFDINDDIPVVGDDQAVLGDLIFSAAGKVIFPGVTAGGGAEIQILDSETLDPLTLEVNPGLADANPQHVTTIGNNVYFLAYDATVGSELRWFDASEAIPTIRTVDVNPGAASSNAGEFGGFTTIGDKLFFTATDDINGTELRWIDTTETTTPTVNTVDIWSGSGDSDAGRNGGFTTVGQTLYFSAKDGAHGVELRWIDTTDELETVNVLDINDGIGGSDAGRDGGFNSIGNKLFFSATDEEGYEPRWIDTTESLPTLNTLTINDNGSSNPDGFEVVGDRVYFWADDNGLYGNELRWVDAESDPNTVTTLDIKSGPSDSRVGQFGGLRSVGDKLFFSADDGINGRELQWIDTTLDMPTVQTLDVASGSSSSNAGELGGFATVGDRLFFTADDRSNGAELRWLDTTLDDMIVSTIDITAGAEDSNAGRFGGFRSVGDKLFFTSMDSESGYKLRWVDGMSSAPNAVAIDVYRGSANSFADGFAVAGDKLFFAALDSSAGTELRWIDASDSAPQSLGVPLLDIYAGATSSSPDSFTVVGDKLFFSANDDDFGTELRWLDTREESPTISTVDVWDGGGGSLAGRYGGLHQVGDKLFFTASDRENGAELRWINTSDVEPVINTLDIEPGSGGSRAGRYGGFVSVGDKLFFAADDSLHGRELRWIDTTDESPTLNTLDIEVGSGDSFAGLHGGFTVVDERVFFTATSNAVGYEPRWVDASTDDPAVNTIDIASGVADSRAGRHGGFTLAGDKLYFTADDDVSGSELRWVNATAETPAFNTIEVNDAGGSFAGEEGGFMVVDDKLFFNANDNDHGKELRWIDTSTESPVIHTVDIKIGSESSLAGANGFALDGDRLFFDADDGVYGSELRWIDTTVLIPEVNTIDIWSGSDGSRNANVDGFVVFDEKLFFAADTFGFGNELFALNLNEVTEVLPGDLNVDGVVDGHDVDIVCSAIGGPIDVALDFDGNETHSFSDVAAYIHDVVGTEIGDANLDGAVDAADLNQVGLHWQDEGGWASGDFNCDTMVNAADLNSVGLNWQFAAGPVAAATTHRSPRAPLFFVAHGEFADSESRNSGLGSVDKSIQAIADEVFANATGLSDQTERLHQRSRTHRKLRRAHASIAESATEIESIYDSSLISIDLFFSVL